MSFEGVLMADTILMVDKIALTGCRACLSCQDLLALFLNRCRRTEHMPTKHTVPLILFLVLVVGGGLVIGSMSAPGGWYAGLAKPVFNPPAWLFGPVWTVLYVMIAVAGWRVWQRERSGLPMKLWWAQMVLNFLWTPAFFGAEQIGLALVVILLMLAAILAFIATARRLDRLAAWLFVPYAGWVTFASLLNGSIWTLN